MTEELVTCEQCGKEKPRSQFRKVAQPRMCKTCIAERKEKRKLIQKVEKTRMIADGGDASGPRTALRLDRLHREMLDALTKRLKCNQSTAIGKALDLLFADLFTVEEQALIAGYAGLFERPALPDDEDLTS